MRYTLAVLAIVASACGGSDEPTVSTADCEAVRQVIAVAAQAYEAINGEAPADVEQMIGDTVNPDQVGVDWFSLDGTDAVPVADGPCS